MDTPALVLARMTQAQLAKAEPEAISRHFGITCIAARDLRNLAIREAMRTTIPDTARIEAEALFKT